MTRCWFLSYRGAGAGSPPLSVISRFAPMRFSPSDDPADFDSFRSRVIAALPRLADAFLGSDDDQRSALIHRDDDLGGPVLSVVLLTHGSAPLEILHQLAQVPRTTAAVVTAWRDLDAVMTATLCCTVARPGVQELFVETYTVEPETDQIQGHGLAALGTFEPGDDAMSEALDVSLVGDPRLDQPFGQE